MRVAMTRRMLRGERNPGHRRMRNREKSGRHVPANRESGVGGNMIILPAIDILDGKPVRLYKGRYEEKTQVGESVAELAKRFEAAGADYLHLVDLDGAKDGRMVNRDLIVEVAKSVSIPVEIGGGIRAQEAIEDYVQNGIDRVILGTVAVEDKMFLKTALKRFGEHIAVGIDSLDGFVRTRGWLDESKLNFLDFAIYLDTLGVKTIIATDISKDGTLEGVNVKMMLELKKRVKSKLIASGGVKSIDDIRALRSLDIYGAITGKAVYQGTLNLEEAIALTRQ